VTALPRATRGLLRPPVLATLALVVTVVVATHGFNSLDYPYLEADEGTYFSQGWSVLHEWRLSPYTYIYDHAPLGWIQIALWQLLAGDSIFGYGLASGRVLMLYLQIGSALLVLAIALRVAGRRWVAVLAVGMFVMSAYGIHYHRRVLLDNVATFWILVSVFALVGPVALRRVWLSALALAIAALSKEIAIVLIPALAVLVARRTPRESRAFAVVGWLAVTLTAVSVYPLAALLKGELFPAGSALGGDQPRVSLICSLVWQSSRAPDGGLLDATSAFWSNATLWLRDEPLLVAGGTAGALLAVTAFRRDVVLSMLGWAVLALWLYIGRGGVVLSFYLVPLLPLLALVLALVAWRSVDALGRSTARPVVAAAIGLLTCAWLGLTGVSYARSGADLWTGRPVVGQVQAVEWIKRNLPADSRMVIDMSMWHDLHHTGAGRRTFAEAHYYWRVGEDPAVRRDAFRNDWRNVDYVVMTPQLLRDTRANHFAIVAPALEHSLVVQRFDSGGWPVEIRHVDASVRSLRLPPAGPDAGSVPQCMRSRA